MSEQTPRVLPEGFQQGPVQGLNVIGETTEALHRWILDGWKFTTPPPRIEEDLSFVPKDREEVVYIYMYRAAHNTNLQNSKQWRPAKISLKPLMAVPSNVPRPSATALFAVGLALSALL